MINIFGRTRRKIRDLESRLLEVQHGFDDLLLCQDSASITRGGNQYPTAELQIIELAKKYEGCADWGSQFAHNIIAVRSAFTIGQGVKVEAKEGIKGDAARELEWIAEFNHLNNLDEGMPQSWAAEAEIEGKFLARLFIGEDQDIFVRFIPWTHTKYVIDTPSDDYTDYITAKWKSTDVTSQEEITVPAPEFVYSKFGGRVHHVNNTPPKIGAVLTEMENMHKALCDWRQINKLFASPTPHFEVEDKRQVDDLQNLIKGMKWKAGKVLITTAKFSMVGIDAAGVESLADEILTNAKIISGNTGVPIHFLGFPGEMSNRSTAENLLELIVASTNKERRIWAGTYEEIYTKAMTLANDKQSAGLDLEAFTVTIPQISAAKIAELESVWLPMFEAGALSLEGFLARVPEIDTKAELKRIEDKEADAAADALEAIKAAKSEAAHNDEPLDKGVDASKGGSK